MEVIFQVLGRTGRRPRQGRGRRRLYGAVVSLGPLRRGWMRLGWLRGEMSGLGTLQRCLEEVRRQRTRVMWVYVQGLSQAWLEASCRSQRNPRGEEGQQRAHGGRVRRPW